MQKALQATKDQLDKTTSDLHHREWELEASRLELELIKKQLAHTMRISDAQRRDLENVKASLQEARFETYNIKLQLGRAVNLGDTCNTEPEPPKGTLMYLGLTLNTVTAKLEKNLHLLNRKIFEAASLLSEAIVYRTPFTKGNADHSEGSRERARAILGHSLACSVKKVNTQSLPNSLLCQVTIQCLLARWCARKASTWGPSDAEFARYTKPGYQQVIGAGKSTFAHRHRMHLLTFLATNSVYSGIDAQNPFAASLWRSATRANTLISSESLHASMEFVIDWLGWDVAEVHRVEVDGCIRSIVERLDSIWKAIRKGSTSYDLTITSIPSTEEVSFDPEYMEEVYHIGGNSTGGGNEGTVTEIVAALCGLGLSKVHSSVGEEVVCLPQVILERSMKKISEGKVCSI